MRFVIVSIFCMSVVACSVQKNLPATCEQQLKNLTALEQDLVAIRAALEVCATQPSVE